MRHEIQERICDECGKTKQMKMIRRFGATPFRGWIRATIEGRDGLTTSSLDLDFCSSKCAGKHFSEFKRISRKDDHRATAKGKTNE